MRRLLDGNGKGILCMAGALGDAGYGWKPLMLRRITLLCLGARVAPVSNRWVLYLLGCTLIVPVAVADPLPETGPCRCAEVRMRGGWCPQCKTGYLAGVRISSKLLFETLDAHGHQIDVAVLRCPSCRKAAASKGYCEPCRMGFGDARVYCSRLAWELSRGEPRDVAALPCADCRQNTARAGWCPRCNLGMVGNVAIRSREGFDVASREFDRLRQSIEMLAGCENCAVAHFTGGHCEICPRPGPNAAATKPPP